MKPLSRHCRVFIFAGVVVCFLQVALLPAVRAAEIFAESEVKSVFLFNLTKFVEWPEQIDEKEKKQFSIAILGNDPFGRHLDEVMKDETVRGEKIAIRRYRKQEEVHWQDIDLLFVGGELLGDLAKLRHAAHRFGVLTVSDVAGFCHAGGMVNLLTAGSRVRLEVNLEEAKKSDFQISSHVLKLADIVTTGMEGEP